MDCDVIRLDLHGFHFGDLDPEPRQHVEAHLASCSSCLQAFLALKRSIETTDARLSEPARVRLREAVVRQVEAPRQPAAWSWWQRPLALVVAVAAVLFATSTVGVLAAGPGGAPHGWVKPSDRGAP